MVICVTNRTLCKDNFLKRVESICQAGPKFIILREKDLDRKEYTQLAAQCLAICKTYGIQLVLHTHIQSALDLGVTAIHLPLSILKQESKYLNAFTMIGTSVHAVEEVAKADTILVLGMNLNSSLCKDMLPHFTGKDLIVIHKEAHYLDEKATAAYHGAVSKILPEVAESILDA